MKRLYFLKCAASYKEDGCTQHQDEGKNKAYSDSCHDYKLSMQFKIDCPYELYSIEWGERKVRFYDCRITDLQAAPCGLDDRQHFVTISFQIFSDVRIKPYA